MRFAIVNDLRIAQEILRHAVAQIPGASVAWVAIDGRDAIQKCKIAIPGKMTSAFLLLQLMIGKFEYR